MAATTGSSMPLRCCGGCSFTDRDRRGGGAKSRSSGCASAPSATGPSTSCMRSWRWLRLDQHASARRLARRLETDTMLGARSGTEELELARPLSRGHHRILPRRLRRRRRVDFGGPGRGSIAVAAALRSATSFISPFSSRRCARSGEPLPVRWRPSGPCASPRAASINGSMHGRGPPGTPAWRRKREFTGAQATNETKKPLR